MEAGAIGALVDQTFLNACDEGCGADGNI